MGDPYAPAESLYCSLGRESLYCSMGQSFKPQVLKVTEFLNFTLIGDTGKTQIIGVGNNSAVKLGLIKWVGAWRKYCFFPEQDTFYDTKCLEEIKAFMGDLMLARNQSSKTITAAA
jgi:hypothetical protein